MIDAHASKDMMDVHFLSSARSEGFSSLKGELDEKLVSILVRLKRKTYGEIAKEVSANFTKAALLDARKKIFNHVVAKEEKRLTLATEGRDANSIDVDDRAALPGHAPSLLRLVNRRSKPLIVDDILLLSLYIEDPRESFPEQVLKKITAKPCTAEPSNAIDSTDDVSVSSDHDEELTEKENETPAAAKEVGRVAGEKSESNNPSKDEVRADDPPIESTKLCSTHTSTSDLIRTRTIATQTADCIVSYKNSSLNPGKDNSLPSESESGKSTDKTDVAHTRIARTRSENSLLEYIDEEFDSLTKYGNDMDSGRYKRSNPDSCDARFQDLEGKYETVLRRVVHLERLHENDLKQLRKEVNGKIDNIITPSNTVAASERPAPKELPVYRSANAIPPANGPPSDRAKDPFDTHEIADVSEWDVEACDIFVSTQDTQGNPVRTKATPFHERELRRQNPEPSIPNLQTGSIDKRAPTVSRPPPDTRMRNTRQTVTRRDEAYERFANNDGRSDSETHPEPPRSTPSETCTSGDGGGRNLYEMHTIAETTYSHRDDRIPNATGRNDCCCDRQAPVSRYAVPNNPNNPKQQTGGADKPPKNTSSDRQYQCNPNSASSTDRRQEDEADAKRRRLNTTDTRSKPSTSADADRPIIKPSSREYGGKSSVGTVSDTGTTNSNGRNLYSKVVTAGGWTEVTGSQNNEKSTRQEFPRIKSAAPSRNKEFYVRGMSCANYKLHKDLEEAVKWYCRERSINTVHQRVIMYNKDNDSVGIKVVVRDQDVEKFMSRGFWPEGISVREWYEGKPTERVRCFGNERSSSDESL